jgi:hypothetical protein
MANPVTPQDFLDATDIIDAYDPTTAQLQETIEYAEANRTYARYLRQLIVTLQTHVQGLQQQMGQPAQQPVAPPAAGAQPAAPRAKHRTPEPFNRNRSLARPWLQGMMMYMQLSQPLAMTSRDTAE